ncbi:MAG: hypothetical protein ABSG41_29730 [Bryobacteraceae bacterium]
MNYRCWLFAMPAFVWIVGSAPAHLTAQTPPAKKWTPPRTPDGQPDFQGNWNTATLTPLERPPEFAGKEFLTAQEAAEYEKRTLEQVNSDRRDGGAEADLRRNYNEFWRDRGTTVVATRRTSLIVDPPDGKVPPLTPGAQRKRAAVAGGVGAPATVSASRPERLPGGPEDLPLRIRCISRDLPMIPTPNNNFLQIVQSAGYVVIVQEMMHEVRIIPLDGRPHLDPRIRGYMGDSRGHWEGNTLLVDTTNFIGTDNFYGADEAMHLTERLTRIDPNTILYQFTVDDPTAFTRPWSGEMSMTKTSQPVEEYACHEGNYSMSSILAGARAAEKRAVAEPRP